MALYIVLGKGDGGQGDSRGRRGENLIVHCKVFLFPFQISSTSLAFLKSENTKANNDILNYIITYISNMVYFSTTFAPQV